MISMYSDFILTLFDIPRLVLSKLLHMKRVLYRKDLFPNVLVFIEGIYKP